jgi:hypothetical protein
MGANAVSRLRTQRDVTRMSALVNDSPFDPIRRRRTLPNSLTRKRSQVQILYGPRHFSKSCLALRTTKGATLLRFCPISAGHGAGIPASAQGVPAVLALIASRASRLMTRRWRFPGAVCGAHRHLRHPDRELRTGWKGWLPAVRGGWQRGIPREKRLPAAHRECAGCSSEGRCARRRLPAAGRRQVLVAGR